MTMLTVIAQGQLVVQDLPAMTVKAFNLIHRSPV